MRNLKISILMALALAAPFSAYANLSLNVGVMNGWGTYQDTQATFSAPVIQLEALYRLNETEFGLFYDDTWIGGTALNVRNSFFGIAVRSKIPNTPLFVTGRIDPVSLIFSGLSAAGATSQPSIPFSGVGANLGLNLPVGKMRIQPQIGVRLFSAPNSYFVGWSSTMTRVLSFDAGVSIGLF